MIYTKYSASGNDFVIFHTFIEKDYSSEIQLASFVFPAAEHRELTGIAKR